MNLQLAERVDHFAVFAVVDIGCDNDVSLITRKPRVFDLAAARDDPDKRDEFQRRIGEIPPVPSNFGPERHEQVLLKCFRIIAVDVFSATFGEETNPMDVQCILGVGGVQASLAQENEVHEAPPSHTRYARVLALLVFRMWPLSTPLRAFSGPCASVGVAQSRHL